MESPAFFELDAPAWRVTGADVPMPYARSLEARALPRPPDVVAAVVAVLGNKFELTGQIVEISFCTLSQAVSISGLLKAAIREQDVFLEDEIMYGIPFQMSDETQSPDFVLPIGKAKIERSGDHITIVCAGKATDTALQAASELAGKGIECEVINLRSLRPLDFNTIAQSIAKTHHLITVEQGWPQSGIGAEICAQVIESPTFFELDAPVWRVTGADVPIPYALALPRPPEVVAAAVAVLGNKIAEAAN
ncbi:unnamed protein product [Euphydryas editha]|uniref:Pyruvate dehydrogenase E1 component subunit beta n=1 Tax=Euphydryas editha TaxID=104508 RepID=A0AAU9TC41_EUPED|nr:unnamed protein product [Euphydryas editha]